MTSTTKLEPKLPQFYPNGGGAKNMTKKLDDLHAKEMAALLAKQEYELHSLKKKHSDQKASVLKPAKSRTTGRPRTPKNVK